MDVDHPDIIEHINFRKRAGGDAARKADNKKSFHVAVNLTDEFMEAVLENKPWTLRCPHTKIEMETLDARTLWEAILVSRSETGEPYLHWIDRSNELLPFSLKRKGLKVHGSNLCSEITLPTAEGYTAVCCLSSVNLEYFDEWCDTTMVEDLIEFLDNVMSEFIRLAPEEMKNAKRSAEFERSLGLGAMGFHSYLQRRGLPFESGGVASAAQWNARMFKEIKEKAVAASKRLAEKRGEPEGCEGTGLRNAHLLAVAPNSNSSTICGCSPSIEPWHGNAFVHTTRAGSYVVKNKYLQSALALRGLDTEEVWQSVLKNDGSIQHLDVSDELKLRFRTAMEMDQHWLVEHAATRQQYICQAQSLNVFFPSGASKDYVNSVHLKAYKDGLKTMYYFRTENKLSVDTVQVIERDVISDWTEEGCKACEG
jgi:ribonucleoside-diphosphate reductase alpha chain